MRVFFSLVVFALMAGSARGQELAELYRLARFTVQAEAHLQAKGMRAVPAEPLHIPSRSDTLLQWIVAMNGDGRGASLNENFAIDAWRLIRRAERNWFEKQHAGTLWAYLGTESLLPIDTTLTRDLRARLEGYFGPPTQTITEVFGAPDTRDARDRFIQFEYWFVLNDSIPLLVMDVNGPLERGLVVSSDYRYRDILLHIRESFMEQFLRSDRRAPYIDYYYNPIESSWYYAGYDGERYFLERTKPPNLALGRPGPRAFTRSGQ